MQAGRGINLNSRPRAKANEIGSIVILDKSGKYRPASIEDLRSVLGITATAPTQVSPTGKNSISPLLNSPGSWYASDGWANGVPFNNGWSKNNAVATENTLTLTLSNQSSSGKPYTGGEYRTIQSYSYGYYETKMKVAKGSGIMNGFFLYGQDANYQRTGEIDIEFTGNNTNQIRCTYWIGQIAYEKFIDLNFDASADFHTYAIDWQQSKINWVVDGKLVHTETGTRSNGLLPSSALQVMMNLWVGDESANSWLGAINPSTLPVTSQFSDFKLYPY